MTCYIDLHNPFTSAFKHNLFCSVKFVWLANFKPKRIASASPGFLAAARLSCIIMAVTRCNCKGGGCSHKWRGVGGCQGGVKISLMSDTQVTQHRRLWFRLPTSIPSLERPRQVDHKSQYVVNPLWSLWCIILLIQVSPGFTAQCTLVQSAVLRSNVVCLSVCLSVCDVGEL